MTEDPDAPTRQQEDDALQDALAAEHGAVWGYGVIGAALPADGRASVVTGEEAHRDVRDRLVALLTERGEQPVPAEAGYALPFPVRSPADAAALGVALEDGVAAAWVEVLGRAAERSTREFALGVLTDTELRAIPWRSVAGRPQVTSAFPGLPVG